MNESKSNAFLRLSLGAAAGLLGMALALPAAAEDREFCANRPGLGTPACTVSPGQVMVETGVADWSRDGDAEARADTLVLGDTLVRVGVAQVAEVQLGWTPFAHLHRRIRGNGAVEAADRAGDALVGFKLNIAHPGGEGFSAAVQSELSLPVGRAPIGAGDWGVNTVVPLSWELPGGIGLAAAPEVDAAVNGDGHGRHLAWGGTVGVGMAVGSQVSASAELQALRDDDPAGHATHCYAGVALAWQAGRNWQLDTGLDAGLNRASEDVALHLGFARRF